jgi:Cd2+/Zn2+-exporting ATPase
MLHFLKTYREAAVSALFLAIALLFQHFITFDGSRYVSLAAYVISYLSVGGPVWIKAFQSLKNGTLFSEFFLMGIATAGAFAIGEYAEGVAVMLFYMIGEYAQAGAVQKARGSIKKLIDEQPDIATVKRNGDFVDVHPSEVEPGEIILVRPGSKVPLDGMLITPAASFNTAALTGESVPATVTDGNEVWAGSINQQTPAEIKVTCGYKDTKLANILELVQKAAQRKAPTQRFITRFAKVYTPIVVWLAVGLTFLPYFFVGNYLFEEWFYRALIFLVVSCPCGLVISVPLGYFGGIGAASQNGILLKGSDYLDRLRRMTTLYLDKTGTMTEGSFQVESVQTFNGIGYQDLLSYAASLEQYSTHPIAYAIVQHFNGQPVRESQSHSETAGKGVSGIVDNKQIFAGNRDFMEENGIQLHADYQPEPFTTVHVAVDGTHAGTITIADRIKSDSRNAIDELHSLGIRKIVMLSGDSQPVVSHIAESLGIDEATGNLMPDQKYAIVEKALRKDAVTGFAGDGINDAPVITLADVGIAMGGIGSDAAIETADVVIQSDQPSIIPLAIRISKFTHRIVWQNIGFALGIKVLIMALAAVGLANMWAAIFADVGVALIAIANAIRVQLKFSSERDLSFFSLLFSKKNPAETESAPPQCGCETCC